MESNFSQDSPPTIIRKPPLRFVQPYEYVFETHAKGRWLKRQLIEVLLSQFRAYSKEYYIKAIQDQRILINSSPTSQNYILKDNDLLVHKTIRVEPPILDLPVKIIKETDDLIVVEKPPGVTIHSGGGFHYNTLMGILFYQFGKRGLYLCHRLDKCTSGVIILAKNKNTSINFHQNNQKFITKKMYYARVGGDFDDQKFSEIDMPIVCLNYKNGIHCVYQKQKHKDLPEYHKHPNKESITVFKKLWYDKQTDSSLLQCYPKTGRTHQIRVHLKYSGYPILNDTVYGGRFVGNNILKWTFPKETYDEFMLENAKVSYKNQQSVKQKEEQVQSTKKCQKQQLPQNKKTQQLEDDKSLQSSIKKKTKLESGEYKQKVIQPIEGQTLQEDEWDFTSRAMQICLHSYKYTFEGVDYVTSLPYWFSRSMSPPWQKVLIESPHPQKFGQQFQSGEALNSDRQK